MNVGVVGLGSVGKRHADTYYEHDGCTLRWLHDIDRPLVDKLSREYDGAKVADRYEDIVDDDEVDLVSVCSFDDDHYGQAISALERGKHLFVEKPLCTNLDELASIKKQWEKADRPALDCNLMSRGSPLYQWLQVFIERGGLGDIYAIDAEYWYGRLHKITDGWRKDVEGYSVMQGGAVHLMDTIFMMTNERPTSCFAVGNRVCTEGSDFRYNDFVTSMYRFPSSMVARVTANFGCVHPHQHILRIFGTDATFLLDDQGPRIHATRDNVSSGLANKADAVTPIDLPYRPVHKGDLIPPLVEQILTGADTSVLAQRNFDVMSAIMAADLSAATGKEVPVPYV